MLCRPIKIEFNSVRAKYQPPTDSSPVLLFIFVYVAILFLIIAFCLKDARYASQWHRCWVWQNLRTCLVKPSMWDWQMYQRKQRPSWIFSSRLSPSTRGWPSWLGQTSLSETSWWSSCLKYQKTESSTFWIILNKTRILCYSAMYFYIKRIFFLSAVPFLFL